MRTPIFRIIIAACILAVTARFEASGQAFSSFILSGKAGESAMGNISFNRPQLLGSKVDATLSYGKWMPSQLDYSPLHAGVFLALGDNFGIRAGYRSNLYSPIASIDVNGNEKGSFKPQEQQISAGISLRIGEGMVLDATGKYLSAEMAGNKGAAFAGDIALSYVSDGLTLGVKGADIGSSYSFGHEAHSLPMRIMAGGSYLLAPAGKHSLTLGGDLGYVLPQIYKSFIAAAGLEYSFDSMVFARAGYHFSSGAAPRYAAFGLGVAFSGIGLDAAYTISQASTGWTLTLRFSR